MARDTVKLNKTCRFNLILFMPEQHGVISEVNKKKPAFLNIGFTVKGFIV